LRNPEFGHYVGLKNKVLCFSEKQGPLFFLPKTYFDPKHLENTIETLLNQSMAIKNPKNHLKTRNPPETKILPKLSSIIFLGVFKVKKTPKRNPRIIWNLLT
jgi:hypothetical protein